MTEPERAPAFRVLRSRLASVAFGALAIFVMLSWVIRSPPSREDLREVDGALTGYTVEVEDSWNGRYRHHRYVLFAVAGQNGRFWNDAVGPGNVGKVFTRAGAGLKFYVAKQYRYHAINGDGVKSYGLIVDGTEVRSVDNALVQDTILAYYVVPALGFAMLLLAVRQWKRATQRGSLREQSS